MRETALRNEVTKSIWKMSGQNLRYVADFAHFMEEKQYGITFRELLDYWEEKFKAEKAARDKQDLEILTANAEYFNKGAEENIDFFQADIWEEEE